MDLAHCRCDLETIVSRVFTKEMRGGRVIAGGGGYLCPIAHSEEASVGVAVLCCCCGVGAALAVVAEEVVVEGCACWDGCCRPEAIAGVKWNERTRCCQGSDMK